MPVWIITEGEYGPGAIRAVHADRDLAKGDLFARALDLTWDIDEVTVSEDGSIEVTAGIDHLLVEQHEVITRAAATVFNPRLADDADIPILDGYDDGLPSLDELI